MIDLCVEASFTILGGKGVLHAKTLQELHSQEPSDAPESVDESVVARRVGASERYAPVIRQAKVRHWNTGGEGVLETLYKFSGARYATLLPVSIVFANAHTSESVAVYLPADHPKSRKSILFEPREFDASEDGNNLVTRFSSARAVSAHISKRLQLEHGDEAMAFILKRRNVAMPSALEAQRVQVWEIQTKLDLRRAREELKVETARKEAEKQLQLEAVVRANQEAEARRLALAAESRRQVEARKHAASAAAAAAESRHERRGQVQAIALAAAEKALARARREAQIANEVRIDQQLDVCLPTPPEPSREEPGQVASDANLLPGVDLEPRQRPPARLGMYSSPSFQRQNEDASDSDTEYILHQGQPEGDEDELDRISYFENGEKVHSDSDSDSDSDCSERRMEDFEDAAKEEKIDNDFSLASNREKRDRETKLGEQHPVDQDREQQGGTSSRWDTREVYDPSLCDYGLGEQQEQAQAVMDVCKEFDDNSQQVSPTHGYPELSHELDRTATAGSDKASQGSPAALLERLKEHKVQILRQRETLKAQADEMRRALARSVFEEFDNDSDKDLSVKQGQGVSDDVGHQSCDLQETCSTPKVPLIVCPPLALEQIEEIEHLDTLSRKKALSENVVANKVHSGVITSSDDDDDDEDGDRLERGGASWNDDSKEESEHIDMEPVEKEHCSPEAESESIESCQFEQSGLLALSPASPSLDKSPSGGCAFFVQANKDGIGMHVEESIRNAERSLDTRSFHAGFPAGPLELATNYKSPRSEHSCEEERTFSGLAFFVGGEDQDQASRKRELKLQAMQARGERRKRKLLRKKQAEEQAAAQHELPLYVQTERIDRGVHKNATSIQDEPRSAEEGLSRRGHEMEKDSMSQLPGLWGRPSILARDRPHEKPLLKKKGLPSRRSHQDSENVSMQAEAIPPAVPQGRARRKLKEPAPPEIEPTIRIMGKSNVNVICNAISHVCLAGSHHAARRENVLSGLRDRAASGAPELACGQYVILFRNEVALKFRGVYLVEPGARVLRKLQGSKGLPQIVSPDMIDSYFKYNTGQRSFQQLCTKGITKTTDAVALNPKYFQQQQSARYY